MDETEKRIEISVRHELNAREQTALKELLPAWQQYTNEKGEHPFADWTEKDLLERIMAMSLKGIISSRIKGEQFRQGIIDVEEFTNGEPFRTKEEREEHEATEETDVSTEKNHGGSRA